MRLERNRIREKRDVPFRCVRSRRDHVLLESRIDRWHQLLRNTFLHVYRFEQTREPRAKDVVHVVGVMEVNERGVCALGCKVTKKHGRDGSHALTVSALIAMQREAMQDMEQRTLPIAILTQHVPSHTIVVQKGLPEAIPGSE